MMSTRFLLLALLLAALLLAAAPAARAQTYYLDLTGQLLSVPNRTVAVEQVVDGREGHAAIGVVYRGLGNKSAAVLFRQGLAPELTAFVQAQLPARPTDHSVVLCLRQLRVSETIARMTEQASADLAADVYEHLTDGYHFVQSVGGHTNARALETTYLHAEHVALLLGQCMEQLNRADWTAAAARKPLSLAALASDVPASLAGGGRRGPVPPILRQAPRRGMYYRFEQFLANRPDTSLAFRLDTIRLRLGSELAMQKWAGVARVRPLPTDGSSHRKEFTGLWGFSDGQQLFVLHNKRFFPLVRQGSFFTFVGEAPLDQEYVLARAEAQARAGVMGVALMNKPDHTAEPMPYALDMRTGELAAYPGSRSSARPDTAFIYVYRPVPATGPALVKVRVNGREVGSLRPGQYLELPWSRHAQPLQLCFDGLPVTTPCQYLVPDKAQLNYLKINASGSASSWQWMPPAQGSADLDELDKQRQ